MFRELESRARKARKTQVNQTASVHMYPHGSCILNHGFNMQRCTGSIHVLNRIHKA